MFSPKKMPKQLWQVIRCYQTIYVSGQTVKVLLSSFCQAVSCHQVINNAPTSTSVTTSIGHPHQPESPQSSVSEKKVTTMIELVSDKKEFVSTKTPSRYADNHRLSQNEGIFNALFCGVACPS